MRYCQVIKYEPVGNFSSVKSSQTITAYKIQARRKNDILFAFRFTYSDDSESGLGAYRRMTKLFYNSYLFVKGRS